MPHTQPITPRVRWDGLECVARHDHIEVVVPFCPPVFPPTAMIVEIDYAPSCRSQRLRELSHAWRDMTADEAAALQSWLDLVVEGVRTAGRAFNGEHG